ncbi:MAG: hypothetical protein INR65_09410 [Gluconacetobacter diazotrophicus]|nr:hypothetical protein [Gluconacetobacter diazotrophicus]
MPILTLTGTVWPIVDGDAFDVDTLPGWRAGDLCLGSRPDANGRRDAKYRHSELGYSGYVTGYLLQGRGRRNIRNWKALFPGFENHYAQEAGKADAEARVRRIAEGMKGRTCRKVIGGWEIDLPATS